LPVNTKSGAVYLVAGVIPIFDELCKRMLNFVLSCYRSDSDLVRFVVKHGMDALMNSPLGRNVTFCSLSYRVCCSRLVHSAVTKLIFRERLCVSKCSFCTQSIRRAFKLIMTCENILSVAYTWCTADR